MIQGKFSLCAASNNPVTQRKWWIHGNQMQVVPPFIIIHCLFWRWLELTPLVYSTRGLSKWTSRAWGVNSTSLFSLLIRGAGFIKFSCVLLLECKFFELKSWNIQAFLCISPGQIGISDQSGEEMQMHCNYESEVCHRKVSTWRECTCVLDNGFAVTSLFYLSDDVPALQTAEILDVYFHINNDIWSTYVKLFRYCLFLNRFLLHDYSGMTVSLLSCLN